MKSPTRFGLLLLAAVTLSAPLARAQITIKPGPVRTLASAEYQLVRAGGKVYRCDARTGATQMLTVTSKPGGIDYSWVPLSETTAPGEAESDRYQVVEGSAETGVLVRLDRKSGRTWIASSHGGAVLRWDEVTK